MVYAWSASISFTQAICSRYDLYHNVIGLGLYSFGDVQRDRRSTLLTSD
jgi:hypothetical protein